MRKIIPILCTALLCLPLLAGCAASPPAETGKLSIVATLFPQYDFARQLVGDRADVRLLLPPGSESHSFEPTPADIIAINKSDLFVYTGQYMEPWAQTIVEGAPQSLRVLDISENVSLDGIGAVDEHDDHDDDHGGFDPHIWTSPRNAKIMVENLVAALAAVDPDNASYYNENAKAYQLKLDAVDSTLQAVVDTAARREIVFGGRFALHYFAERYKLDYVAAYDSCSGETEPSARVVAQIIDKVKADKLPVIFYEELTDPKVARAIAEETGAKLLLLHSCHNVSRDEMESGATYLSLMEQNAANLKEGLN